MTTTDPDQASIAIHEAGHAVTAICFGFGVRYATIAPRNGGGVVVLNPRRRGFPAQATIASCCAGMISQDVSGVDERWNIVEDSQADDITNIRAYARAWHAASDGVTVLDLITRSWEVAYDLIVDHYGAVLAVAQQLLSSRRALTGHEIRSCFNGAPVVRPDPVPADGRTFWVPAYSRLRNWGPSAAHTSNVNS